MLSYSIPLFYKSFAVAGSRLVLGNSATCRTQIHVAYSPKKNCVTVTRAALSHLGADRIKIGAPSTGSISASDLLAGVETAAQKGAEVVMEAVHQPRNIDYKGKANLVTDTDNRSELAIKEFLRERFQDHLILGEEGGFTGDPSSEYLWCIDPLGTAC